MKRYFESNLRLKIISLVLSVSIVGMKSAGWF